MSASNEVRIGDKVISKDGHGMGEVKHLVIDPAKREIAAFIVDKGLFDRGRVCDYGYVDNVDGDKVVLTLNKTEAEESAGVGRAGIHSVQRIGWSCRWRPLVR